MDDLEKQKKSKIPNSIHTFAGKTTVNEEFHGTLISSKGIVYDEIAIKALLIAVLFGKAYIVQYKTKTDYRFELKR